MQDTADLDEARLTPEARSFAAKLFSCFPELRRYAAMERVRDTDAWTLVIKLAAPSCDPKSELVLWVDRGDEPSVAFGPWHTHQSIQTCGSDEDDTAALLDVIAGILSDRLIVFEDGGGAAWSSLLETTREDAILEKLTSRASSGRAHLRSWSGRLDREVSLGDFEQETPA